MDTDRVRTLFCDGLLLHEGMDSERRARQKLFDTWLAAENARVFNTAYLMGASHVLMGLRGKDLEPDRYNLYREEN